MKPVEIISTVLGFHGLCVIRDKMHLLLEIFIFYLAFPNAYTFCCLLDNRHREYIANNHFTRLLIVASFRGGRDVQWCLVNFQCRGVLLVWVVVEQGPTALAVGAGGGCLDVFAPVYHFSSFSLSGRRPNID